MIYYLSVRGTKIMRICTMTMCSIEKLSRGGKDEAKQMKEGRLQQRRQSAVLKVHGTTLVLTILSSL